MNCSVKVLELPEGFEGFTKIPQNIVGIDTLIWPLSFKKAPNTEVDTIYYRGSELMWNLIEDVEKVKYNQIYFNYEGDGSELQG